MKRVLSLLMVGLMLVGVSGCGPKPGHGEVTSFSSTATDEEFEITTNPTGDSTNTYTDASSLNYSETTSKGGSTATRKGTTVKPTEISLGGLKDAKLPAFSGVKGTKVKLLTTDNPSSDTTKKIISGFKDAYGADLEYVPTTWNDVATNLSKMVMADNAPDITILRPSYDYPMVTARGLTQAVDGKLDLNSPLWQGTKWLVDANRFQGKHHQIISDISVSDIIWYNKKMMQNAGIRVLPDKLYEQGKWDWNALVDIGKQLTDTKASTPTYGLGSDFLLLYNDVTNSRGTALIKYNKNGTQSLNLFAPELAEALDFYGDLYTKHKIMAPDGQDRALFIANRLGMFIQGSWMTQSDEAIGNMYKKGTIGLVPIPAWPGMEPAGNITITSYAIPKGAKNVNGGLALASYRRFLNVDKKTVQARRDEVVKAGLLSHKEYGYLDKAASKGFIRVSLIGDTARWIGGPFRELQAGSPWSRVAKKYQANFQKCVDEYNALLKE